MQRPYGDPAAVRRGWASNATGLPLDSGHHTAEDAPAELTGFPRT